MTDQRLYELLSQLRLQLAKQNQMPAFTIFSNRTLAHMCEILPQTKEAFFTIQGVGPIKWEQYGQLFLDAIIQYCSEHKRNPDSSELNLASLLEKMISLYRARDWEQFHSPKNLVMNLASEIGELTEIFRWLTEKQSYTLNAKTFEEASDELGDVFNSLLYLAHKLGIDLVAASHKKLLKLERKYPIDKCRGKALKYTHYEKNSF